MVDKEITKKVVLYFGITDENYSRNKVYIEGLRRNGFTVKLCIDKSSGLRKYWRLFKKHWSVRKSYDVMVVSYSSYIIVPFARLITRKPVIFDALCSFYESEIISRDAFKGNPFRIPFVRSVDWMATHFAHHVLVETDRQKQYFIDELGVRPEKLVTVYTGVDDSAFYIDQKVEKSREFTVLFRGRIMIEAGVTHILEAAKLLEDEDIRFLIIGFGWNEALRRFQESFSGLNLKKLEYIGTQIPIDALRSSMLKCHVSLGQFEDNERLKRTIPHKAFESLAMKLPYLTARAEGVMEILKDGVNCLMVNPADPVDLAKKIKMLRDDRALADKLNESGYKLYLERFTPEKIVEPIIKIINRSK